MQAIIFRGYGSADVLEPAEVPTPAPGRGELLVRVRAAGVSAEDPRIRAFDHPGPLRPVMGALKGFRRPRPSARILGMEYAGEVVRAGTGVGRFAPGERVFGYTGIRLGAYAEYVCVRAGGILARAPDTLGDVEAACLPNGALSALVFLRDLGGVRHGDHVLVNGASGSVGTAAVQLAKHFGARVTAVCSTPNLRLVRSLGADAVIDYTRERLTDRGGPYDIVFDTVNTTSFEQVATALKPTGRYVVTHLHRHDVWPLIRNRFTGRPRVITGAATMHWRVEHLEFISRLVEAGEYVPVVDRCYPLADAALAHRYVEQGHKRGNVVLTVP